MSAFGFNTESVGQAQMFSGVTTLLGVILMNRVFSPVVRAHKISFVLLSFGIGILFNVWLSLLSPDASLPYIFIPLALQGLAMALQLGPMPMMTFGDLVGPEFADGYRVKNMVRQMTNAVATAVAVLFIDARSAVHQQYLASGVNPLDPAYQHALSSMAQGFVAQGYERRQAMVMALGTISNILQNQEILLSCEDIFRFFALCYALFAVVILVWVRIQRARSYVPHDQSGENPTSPTKSRHL